MTNHRLDLAVTLVDSTGSTPLAETACELTLDEGNSPYATATLTIAAPAAAVYARLDPIKRPRVRLTAVSRNERGTSLGDMTADLLVISRNRSRPSGDVVLTLANDEALLDYAPAEDVDLRIPGLQLSFLLTQVVARATPGSTVTGPATTIVTSFEQRNLIPGGAFEDGPGQWTAVNASATAVNQYPRGGVKSLRISPTNTSPDSYVEVSVSLTPGKTYRLAGWITAPTPFAGGARVDQTFQRMAIMNRDGGDPTVLFTTAWPARVSWTTPLESARIFTMPEGRGSTTLRLYNGMAQGSGDVFWDNISLYEVDDAVAEDRNPTPYFDGDTADTSVYVHAWDGEAGRSTSRRIPIIERRPEMLLWRRGQTARDFLKPILETYGLRLFCGTNRAFQAVRRDYVLSALPVTTADISNVYTASEPSSIDAQHPDGSPLWADAVSIRYTWLDTDGVQQERFDVAAPAGYTRLYSLELTNTPYPGPGQASYLRDRFMLRRAEFAFDRRLDFFATPGYRSRVDLSDGTLLIGYVDRASMDFFTGRMSVNLKAVEVTSRTAWVQLPSGDRWIDSPVGASWASETA